MKMYMKKKIMIRICILIVAVLLISGTQHLEDGGITVYRAIQYSVEKVHRLTPDFDTTGQEYLNGTVIKVLGIEVFNHVE